MSSDKFSQFIQFNQLVDLLEEHASVDISSRVYRFPFPGFKFKNAIREFYLFIQRRSLARCELANVKPNLKLQIINLVKETTRVCIGDLKITEISAIIDSNTDMASTMIAETAKGLISESDLNLIRLAAFTDEFDALANELIRLVENE